RLRSDQPAGRYPAPYIRGARTFLPGHLSVLAGAAVRPTDALRDGEPRRLRQGPRSRMVTDPYRSVSPGVALRVMRRVRHACRRSTLQLIHAVRLRHNACKVGEAGGHDDTILHRAARAVDRCATPPGRRAQGKGRQGEPAIRPPRL